MISIIIVNHNTGNVLKNCVRTLYDFEQSVSFEIILVDNNSSDDTKQVIEQIASEKKNVKTIFLEEDQGYSFANNRGFEVSSGDYILIMNPDIIFTQSIFEKLLKNFNYNPELGALSPLLIGTDGKFQRNYFQRYPTIRQFIFFYSFISKPFFKIPKLVNRYLRNEDINPDIKTLEIVEQIPCAFFFTRKSVFEKAGKMDEGYKLFFEDVDLSYQTNKYYKLAVDTSLRIIHLGGASIINNEDWWVYGRFIMSMNHFFDRNYNWLRAFLLKALSVKNSIVVLFFEYIKSIFGMANDYRIKRHKYFLTEFIKRYF